MFSKFSKESFDLSDEDDDDYDYVYGEYLRLSGKELLSSL